jgi:hypothetical protein
MLTVKAMPLFSSSTSACRFQTSTPQNKLQNNQDAQLQVPSSQWPLMAVFRKLAFPAMLKRRTQGLHPHIKDAQEVKSLVCSIVSTSGYKSNACSWYSCEPKTDAEAPHNCIQVQHLSMLPATICNGTLLSLFRPHSPDICILKWAGCSRATSRERTLT